MLSHCNLPHFAKRIRRPKIIDFGGCKGTHFLTIKNVLPGRRVLHHILELPHIVEEQKKEWEINSEIDFFTSFEELPDAPYDIFYASASLMYLPDPIQYIDAINKTMNPEYLLLERHPFVTDGPTQIITHNDLTYRIHNLGEMVKSLLDLNFAVIGLEKYRLEPLPESLTEQLTPPDPIPYYNIYLQRDCVLFQKMMKEENLARVIQRR